MAEEIVNLLYQNRNDEQAVKMAAYMKNLFPFLGISKPLRAKLQNDFIKMLGKSKRIDWDFVNLVWNLPEREFQYLAVEYLLRMKNDLQKEDINRLEFIIVHKSWWDTVDVISTNLIGSICIMYPDLINSYISNWAETDNLWLRRTAILFQLKYKENTDQDLLAKIILKNNNSREFFINKANGWALREYSKSNPQWVRGFIENHSLHPLTIREGIKYCR